MSNSIDYKHGYRDAIQFAISEINESTDNFLIDEKENIISNSKFDGSVGFGGM